MMPCALLISMIYLLFIKQSLIIQVNVNEVLRSHYVRVQIYVKLAILMAGLTIYFNLKTIENVCLKFCILSKWNSALIKGTNFCLANHLNGRLTIYLNATKLNEEAIWIALQPATSQIILYIFMIWSNLLSTLDTINL